jgi:hypothetical protein
MPDVARPAVTGKTPLLLVSLCNVGEQTPSSLLLVDVLSWEVTPLAVAAGAGATGLCKIGDEILVAYQTAESAVAVLDARTLQVLREVPVPGARDVHSLVAWKDGVAVASSGTDEVLWYRYDGSVFVDRTVLWAAGAARRDTVHVNGLTTHGDALICCAFGARRSEGDLWSESQNGFVYDVVNERVVLDGLGHPHSVASLGDELFLCESSRKRFRSVDRPIAELHGYTRGVAWVDGGRVVVGTSRGRVRSRSSNQLLNPADDGIAAGDCALHVVGLDGAVHEMVSLAGYGREIYDVLRLR